MSRSRGISDLSRELNGAGGMNYHSDDYSNGPYLSDDPILRDPSYLDASEEEEDEGHLLIDFGKRRRSHQEAMDLAKRLDASTLEGKIEEETSSLASSRDSAKPKKDF